MTRVLIGAPVRQKPHIFREYLNALDRLVVPDGVEIAREFVLHGCPELEDLLRPEDRRSLRTAQDVYDTAGGTHAWQRSNFNAVASMRNELLQHARDGGYDYLFLVDSDLILHPSTLTRLLSRQLDIVAEIFWTAWRADDETVWPNCWDFDRYSFNDEESFTRYKQPGLYRTGGLGACTLIARSVLQEPTVNYTPLYNVPYTIWEDRAFCLRAVAHGFELYVDTTCPARHLYREGDYQRYKLEGHHHEA